MDVVGYIRVSTRHQDASGLGLEAQAAAIRTWARANDHRVIEIFEDVCSGTVDPMAREAFTAAVGANVPIVVAKRDRLARDAMHCMIVERLCTLISVEGHNGDTPQDALMRGMLDLFAEYERKVIGARTKAAMAAKRARGEVMGRVAMDEQIVNGQRVKNEMAVRLLKRVRMMRDEGMSRPDIAEALAADGIRNSKGNTFGVTQITRMFKVAV